MPEIIIPEGLEKICAAIYEPTIKSRKPRGIGICLVPEFFTFNPPGTGGIGKDGELHALSNCQILYTKCTLIHRSKLTHSCHHTSTTVPGDTYQGDTKKNL